MNFTPPNRKPARPPLEGWQIAATAHDVYLRDHSHHRLHLVELLPGLPSRALRAVRLGHLPEGQLAVFDVTYIAPALTEELPRTAARDVGGLVMYELRALYPTAAEFARAVGAVMTARGTVARAEAPRAIHAAGHSEAFA